MKNVRVLKFGGTSVSSRERWETVKIIVQRELKEGRTPFVVCSAMSGVSNLLETLMTQSPQKDSDWETTFAAVKTKYEDLANELGVTFTCLEADLETLYSIALGASLTNEASPRLWAKALSVGELLLTRLGAAFLNEENVETLWIDARDYLMSQNSKPNRDERRHFLSADCDFSKDENLISIVANHNGAIITQGFIASDENQETLLLGRGGSDTSAAYFAAKLDAESLEIWTDVPGMFTANPRAISSARLLKELHYEEAQEIATTGAKVLHPRCIEPARRNGIPLFIRCTQRPDLDGTRISSNAPDFGPQVKAISSKDGIVLISMSTVGMWQQVGFLADVFTVFKTHGFSIDLVATSETNVTVTLDPGANRTDAKNLDALLNDLSGYCVAERIGPCTAVSLVGQKIRTILHRLGNTFEAFEEQNIFLLSQAASDLNLTFVVSEDKAKKLVEGLHTLLFEEELNKALFGRTWREIFSDIEVQVGGQEKPWWEEKRELLLGLETPTYVYDLSVVERQAERLLNIESLDRVYYAMKANDNEQVLKCLEAKGVHFECVSMGEVERVLSIFPNLDSKRILFTPNFASKSEYEKAIHLDTHLTVDSLFILRNWGELFTGKDILLRVDPGEGDGHHRFVKTAGKESKFGISFEKLDEVKSLCAKHNINVFGIHAHIGSGILKSGWWAKTGMVLGKAADMFPDVRILNLGGGLGVAEKAWQHPLNADDLNKELKELKQVYQNYDLWMEPGRYFVAEAGVLLAKVTQIKSKGSSKYIGLETGMNTLIRPALYGSYHRIVNLSRFSEPVVEVVDIVGPICESGDVLGHKRRVPKSSENDVFLIATTGAYGRTMSSNYNRRKPAAEICVGGSEK